MCVKLQPCHVYECRYGIQSHTAQHDSIKMMMNLKSLHMNVHSSDVDNVSFITVTLRCQSVLFTGIYAAMWNSDQMDFMQVQHGYGG